MMYSAPIQPEKGQNILQWAKRFSAWARSLQVLAGQGVLVKQSSVGTTISIQGGFTGIVYLAGTKIDMRTLEQKDWIKVNVSAGTAVYADGPAPNPFPSNEEWYERRSVWGDLHVTRFG